jgi:hypothetical protein
MQTKPVLVSRPEAARLLGVSTDTLGRMVLRGVIEEIRWTPSMHPRFRLEDVLALTRRGEGDP